MRKAEKKMKEIMSVTKEGEIITLIEIKKNTYKKGKSGLIQVHSDPLMVGQVPSLHHQFRW